MHEKERSIDTFDQLLGDDSFIQWIVNPTPGSNSYWQEKIESDLELGENIRILKKIIENLRIEEPSLSTTQKQEIWSKIEEATIKKDTNRTLFYKRGWVKVASVAAVIAVIAINVYIFGFYDLNRDSDEIDYISVLKAGEKDFDLTTSDVTLVLSDNEQINLQSDSTEVVYGEDGKLIVNSEEVAAEKEKKADINQLMVPYGKIASLTLSDGTKVWLNSGSRLAYMPVFDENKREVFLVGEAYFDVKKDESRPFIIKTNQMDVAVTGTTLNVSAYDNESLQTVVLVSGKVEVNSKGGKDVYKMQPNQLFSYDLFLAETSVKKVDVSLYISWVDGYLLLQSESLDRLLMKLGRHYNIRIHYNKEEMQKIKVSGKLDLQKDIHKIFDYISTTAPIVYNIEGSDVTVKLKR